MGVSISVSGKKRPWEDLKRKISRGVEVEEAARQCGIPLSEVLSHISEQMSEVDALNYELQVRGQRAIKKALTKLTKLTNSGAREGKDFESTDLEAAKALAKLGVETLKLARTGRAVRERGQDEDGQKDLFDTADPWKLKDVE